jgi:RNA polymerase sigma-70 factor (ECF subfamily)
VRLRAGDPTAPAELAETWGPLLYRYLIRLLADQETARDLTQETLMRACQAMRRGTLPNHLSAWLYRIATNLARDDQRSAYRHRVTLCDTVDGPDGRAGAGDPAEIVAETAVAAQRREAVSRAVRGLAPELREVIVLRFAHDLPVKTIAEIAGIPEGTAKSRLFRAYRILERELAAWRLGQCEEGDRYA